MRFRTHAVAATLTGLLLYPHSPRRAALVAVGGVALDIDHFVLYAVRSGDWSPTGAMRYNRYRARRPRLGDTRPRYGPLRSVAHQPLLTLTLLVLTSLQWPMTRPLGLGVALHLLLDAPQWLGWDWRVWRRANGHCERCGAARPLRIYLRKRANPRQGFWSLERRIALCAACARS